MKYLKDKKKKLIKKAFTIQIYILGTDVLLDLPQVLNELGSRSNGYYFNK